MKKPSSGNRARPKGALVLSPVRKEPASPPTQGVTPASITKEIQELMPPILVPKIQIEISYQGDFFILNCKLSPLREEELAKLKIQLSGYAEFEIYEDQNKMLLIVLKAPCEKEQAVVSLLRNAGDMSTI